MTENPSRSKKFLKDLGIYAIGNLGSKLITFLLVPFYTHYITNTADYGYYELTLTISFCFIPLLCFQMTDGGFRLLIETKELDRHRAIISFITKTLLTNSLFIILLAFAFNIFHPIKFLPYILAFGITQTVYEVTIQVARGLGHTKTFVAAGICNAFSTALLSIILLAGIGMGIEGIFTAAICAKIITLYFIDFRLKLFRTYIRRHFINRAISKELLKYSLPLIPVAFCWWLITANNQFFIERNLGLTENGFYGLACKFSGILYVFCNIFYQTWQQNAIEQYNSPDRDKFFSTIFNSYFFILCITVSAFPFIIRLVYPWLVGSEYQESSKYIFANSIYIMTFALSAFFEIGYQCSKNTARILPSLLFAICISISCNILLIKSLGIYGVICSSIITFAFLTIYRAIDTHKYIRIKFSAQNIVPACVMLLLCYIYHVQSSPLTDVASCFIASFISACFLPKNLKDSIFSKILRKHKPAQ